MRKDPAVVGKYNIMFVPASDDGDRRRLQPQPADGRGDFCFLSHVIPGPAVEPLANGGLQHAEARPQQHRQLWHEERDHGARPAPPSASLSSNCTGSVLSLKGRVGTGQQQEAEEPDAIMHDLSELISMEQGETEDRSGSATTTTGFTSDSCDPIAAGETSPAMSSSSPGSAYSSLAAWSSASEEEATATGLVSSIMLDDLSTDEAFDCFGGFLFGADESPSTLPVDEGFIEEHIVATTSSIEEELSKEQLFRTDDHCRTEAAEGLLRGGVESADATAAKTVAEDKAEVSRDPKTRLYHCPSCPKTFQYGSRLQRHLSAHQRKRFRCHICDKLFSRKDVLENHLGKVHEQFKKQLEDGGDVRGETAHEVSKGTKQLFSCHLCKAQLRSRHHLERHLRSHRDSVGHFVCEHCGKEFSVKHKYQRHMRVHVGERKFKCQTCGRAFLQREFLARHELTHSGENPFACEICGRKFNQLVNLKQHRERIHSGHGATTIATKKKQPAADSCNSNVSCRTVLGDSSCVAGRAMSGGGKSHICHVCDKAFFTPAELRNHSAYHSAEGRSHQCSSCPSSFYEKRHLERHIRRVHSRIRNFFCSDCGKTFFERYELTFHKKRKCSATLADGRGALQVAIPVPSPVLTQIEAQV